MQIDGQVFTEWRHKEWVAPFLYPVIGPNGENVTRHYPMQAGVPGEEPDHPHHRSIRFSHSDVNGFNFWWAPGKEKAGHTAEIQLEKIEKIASGSFATVYRGRDVELGREVAIKQIHELVLSSPWTMK